MQYGKALGKYLRVPPRKARLAADLIRREPVEKALFLLKNGQTKGAHFFARILESAIANAESEHEVERKQLVVLEACVDEGPRLKRGRSCSRGRRSPVLKRMSHLRVVVGTKE